MMDAYEKGGYRERYAMEHGNKIEMWKDGQHFWKFTYSKLKPYQDANGALYNLDTGTWVE